MRWDPEVLEKIQDTKDSPCASGESRGENNLLNTSPSAGCKHSQSMSEVISQGILILIVLWLCL